MSQDDVREVPLRFGPIDAGATIGHVHLKVADLERALAFYCGILGFELMQRYGTLGGVHLGRRLSPPHRPEHLGEPRRAAAAAAHDRPLPRRHPLPERAALADALRRLIASGIPLDGASDHGVSEALYLRDPDDNGVELYWDRPEAAWPRTADGRAGDVHAAAERAGAARGPRRPAGGATGRGPRQSRSPRLGAVAKARSGERARPHHPVNEQQHDRAEDRHEDPGDVVRAVHARAGRGTRRRPTRQCPAGWSRSCRRRPAPA